MPKANKFIIEKAGPYRTEKYCPDGSFQRLGSMNKAQRFDTEKEALDMIVYLSNLHKIYINSLFTVRVKQ